MAFDFMHQEAERIAAERKAAEKESEKAPAPSPAPTPAPTPSPATPAPLQGINVPKSFLICCTKEDLWEVVGGVDKGGIMVREGESTTSTQTADRLSTGAIVLLLELKGDRLHYKLKSGTGPEEGWVSLSNGPKRRPPPWKNVKQPQISYQEMTEIASKNDPGDYYGMKFPYTKDMIVQMGPEWLTQDGMKGEAFHKSGVLPRDNAVTKISDAKEFVGGGAGLKCTFTVEYKKDAPYLHKKLFAKLPHKPGGSDRYYVSCMWNHDRPEIVFNIFLQESWKGKKEFQPGEIEPAYDKYKDWELPDGGPMYYTACCRALGKMAAYHKQKRLHPKVDEMFPMPDPVPQIPPLPGMDDITRKQTSAKEITDPLFLSKWKEELLDIADYQGEMHCFLSGAETANPHDYVGLTHNNLQIDNAFFWRNAWAPSSCDVGEKNEVEVGLLDWGILNCGPLAGSVQGCISGASTEVLLEHRDAFLEAFASSYEQNGGALQENVKPFDAPVVRDRHQQCGTSLEDIKDWMDPRLVDRFQTRAHTTQFKESLQLYRKWDLYSFFKKSVGTYCSKNTPESRIWKAFAGTWAKLKEREVEILHNSTLAEIVLGFWLIVSLFLPSRQFLICIMYWNFLRQRYQVPRSHEAHLKAWRQINAKAAPLLQAAPFLNKPLDMAKGWFAPQ
eukprot:s934_g4.t1